MPVIISGVGYILRETVKGLLRNRWMCLTSTGVVAVTLLMLGIFMLLSLNVNHITDVVKEQVEIVAFIDDQADHHTVAALRQKLADNPAVREVRYVSSEEHMERLSRQLGNVLEGYDTELDNPLLASFEVRAVVPENVSALAAEIERYSGVSEVFYGQGYVENLFSVIRVLQLLGLILMMGLSATAVFLIAHTIGLMVMMRKKEIAIMKYVGATNWFIRWPFLLEGLLMGLVGAIIPLVVLYFLYQHALDWVTASNVAFISMLPLREVIFEVGQYLLPLGIGLGILGSSFSISRFLKV